MQALKSQTALRRGGIVYLRTDELTPNPVQPRKRFDDESLEELSGSIKSYGILNPLTVRLRCGKYELVEAAISWWRESAACARRSLRGWRKSRASSST